MVTFTEVNNRNDNVIIIFRENIINFILLSIYCLPFDINGYPVVNKDLLKRINNVNLIDSVEWIINC